MVDAVSVLRAGGNQNPDATITAAQLEGLDPALGATCMSLESNGRNVWGGDPVSTGGHYIPGGLVTRDAYLAYKAAVLRGEIGRQGVGPAQCTSSYYQNMADALGGCWDPIPNMRAGFRGLGGLIRQYGVRNGARRYNGSGTRAENYADRFMARYATWRSQLAGASVIYIPTAHPLEEDDMPTVGKTLPAGRGMQQTIICPVFDPSKTSTLWLVTGYTVASIRSMAFIRDKGPGLTPQQEGWGGTGAFGLTPGDRPSWPLPPGCTSIDIQYDSDHDIEVMVVA